MESTESENADTFEHAIALTNEEPAVIEDKLKIASKDGDNAEPSHPTGGGRQR